MDPLYEPLLGTNVCVCSLDADFRILDPDKTAKFKLRLNADGWEKNLEDIISQVRVKFTRELKSILLNGYPVLLKDIPLSAANNGGMTLLEIYLIPVFKSPGKVACFKAVFTVLENNPEYIPYQLVKDDMLQIVMDTIPQRIYWKDINLNFVGCNRAFLEDAGFSDMTDIIGKTDYDCAWKDYADVYRRDDLDVIKRGVKKTNVEEMQAREKGRVSWIRITKVPIKNSFGEIVGVFGSYDDITDEKIAEQKLQESETKYRELINFLPQTIFELDEQGYFTFISPNGLKAFGISSADVKNNLHGSTIVAPDERARALRDFSRIYKSADKNKISEYTGIRKDLSTFPIAVSSSAIKRRGVVTGIRGIVFDLTEVKHVQQELLKEKNMLKAFVTSLPDVSFILDENGRYVEFLSVNESLLLRSSSELKDRYLHDFFPQEEADRFVKSIKQTIKTKEPHIVEYGLTTQEGKFSWFQGRTSYLRDDVNERDLVIWTAREITELKRIQSELEESRENLSVTLESIGDAVVATDKEGRIVRMNAVAEGLTGWTREEAMGLPIEKVFKLLSNASGKEIVNPIYEALREGKIVELGNGVRVESKNGAFYQIADSAAPIRKKNGELLGAIVVFHDVTDKYYKERRLQKSEGRLKRAQAVGSVGDWEHTIGGDLICGSEEAFRIYGLERKTPCIPMAETLKNIHPEDVEMVRTAFRELIHDHKRYNVEYRIYRGPERELRYVRSIGQIFDATEGKPIVLGAIQDITSSKLAEEELKTRNAELNNFVYRVSHDLRAPLSSIKGLINLQKLHGSEGGIDYAAMMEKSINKLDLFIRDILSHSRNLNTVPKYDEIDFNEVIEHCFEELEFMTEFDAIKKTVNISQGKYFGDHVRIYEIFRNLISNGIKYSHPGRSEKTLGIDIRIDDREAIICIEDNGIGIPYNIQSKVFDMFYRGHEKSEGSGIGLYIVKQAVQKLNGSIMLESAPSEGSKFTLKLPNVKTDGIAPGTI